MTEKELIAKIKELKTIKPRNSWVVLNKTNILGSDPVREQIPQKANYAGMFPALLSLVYGQRKLAYSFAVLLFAFVSLRTIDVLNNPSINKTDSTASVLDSQEAVAFLVAGNDVETEMKLIQEKSKVLAQVYPKPADGVSQNDDSQQKKEQLKELKSIVSNVTEVIQKDPRLAKVAAGQINDSITYLNVIDSEDLQETSGAFVKTIVEGMFDYYKTVTLTPEKQEELTLIEKSYLDGEYTPNAALEAILILNANSESEDLKADTVNDAASDDPTSDQQPQIVQEEQKPVNEESGEN